MLQADPMAFSRFWCLAKGAQVQTKQASMHTPNQPLPKIGKLS